MKRTLNSCRISDLRIMQENSIRNKKIYFYKTLLMKLENMHRHYLKYFLCNIIQPNYFNSLCLNFFIELIVCNFDFFYVPKDKLIRYVTSKLSNCTYSKHWLNLRVRQPKFFKFFHVLYCWWNMQSRVMTNMNQICFALDFFCVCEMIGCNQILNFFVEYLIGLDIKFLNDNSNSKKIFRILQRWYYLMFIPFILFVDLCFYDMVHFWYVFHIYAMLSLPFQFQFTIIFSPFFKKNV